MKTRKIIAILTLIVFLSPWGGGLASGSIPGLKETCRLLCELLLEKGFMAHKDHDDSHESHSDDGSHMAHSGAIHDKNGDAAGNSSHRCKTHKADGSVKCSIQSELPDSSDYRVQEEPYIASCNKDIIFSETTSLFSRKRASLLEVPPRLLYKPPISL